MVSCAREEASFNASSSNLCAVAPVAGVPPARMASTMAVCPTLAASTRPWSICGGGDTWSGTRQSAGAGRHSGCSELGLDTDTSQALIEPVRH
eukprot:243730-Prorocentrum_minimum.AAC.9